MIPGKLYRVTDHPYKSQVWITDVGPSLQLRTHVMIPGIWPDRWIDVYENAVVMWIGKQDTEHGTRDTVLYGDYGVCAIGERWGNEDLAKKLVPANTK